MAAGLGDDGGANRRQGLDHPAVEATVGDAEALVVLGADLELAADGVRAGRSEHDAHRLHPAVGHGVDACQPVVVHGHG